LQKTELITLNNTYYKLYLKGEKMKVYLIETSSGSYDDYYTNVEVGYLNKDKAQKYVDDYNRQYQVRMKQAKECLTCKYNDRLNINEVLSNCLIATIENMSDIQQIGDNETGYLCFTCSKEEDYYDLSDEHEPRIKEIEIIEED